ncbi:hypothetical protein Bca4012_049542 [Brassica carinata]
MQVFQIWKTSWTTYLLVVWKSSGSRLDFLEVLTTYLLVVWKSSGLLGSLLTKESERYVVFSSQEWKKKKGKSILGALRASSWLFMVVVVLMTMAIL